MSRSQVDWKAALALHRKGWTYSEIGRKYGIHYTTVSLRLRALGAKSYSSPAWDTVKGRRLYGLWSRTRSRCKNSNDPAFQHYGGRGIRVSPAWDRFRPFYEWAIRTGYRTGERLVLIDEGRDFAPGNCRWSARRRERQHGRQRERGPNAFAARIHAFGEVKTVAEWARDPRCSISVVSLRERLIQGIAPEVAITSRATPGIALPKAAKAVITRHSGSSPDWSRALRLRKRGMSLRDIADHLGVPYPTIQSGLWMRLGPAVTPRAPKSHDRRRLYQIWRSVLSRTTDPKNRQYRANGELGVRVCREWREFDAFRSWALRSGWKPRLCLGRIELRGPYSPANCEWITRGEMSERYRGVWRR